MRQGNSVHSGDLLTEMLINYGVEHIFGVPGGQTGALYDGVRSRAGDIQHVLMRDERSAAYAADAYARVTGRVGVCDATVGPGATKLPSGLAEAKHSSIPVLALLSDINQAHTGLADFGAASQALEQLEMLRPLVKWQAKATRQALLPELLRTALRQATTGRPGPAVLDIPEDVFNAEFTPGSLDSPARNHDGTFPSRRSAPEADAIGLAAHHLMQSERPVIVAGGGILISRAEQELVGLAATLDVPVATTWSGKGSIAENHPLALGLLGNMGTTAAQEIVDDADLVFMIGTKSAQNSTFSWSVPRADQRVLHLDVDPAEIGKVFATAVGLAGDAQLGLALLQERVRTVARPRWRAKVAAAKARWERQREEERASNATPITPQRVIGELQRRWGATDLLVSDASFSCGWGGAYLELPAAGRHALFPRGIAGLGWGLPAAIGARFGHSEGTVVCLAGDGGFAYSLGELATAAHYKLKIVAIVLNNRALSWIKWNQRINWGGRFQSSDFPDVNFALVAEGFGVRGVRVSEPEELGTALERAFAHHGPTVIDIITDEWETPIFAYRAAVAQRVDAGYL
jgi:acetolactate synthase-1/2/3 large subunit